MKKEKEEINLLGSSFFTPAREKRNKNYLNFTPFQEEIDEQRRQIKEKAEGKDE